MKKIINIKLVISGHEKYCKSCNFFTYKITTIKPGFFFFKKAVKTYPYCNLFLQFLTLDDGMNILKTDYCKNFKNDF